jgi:hypothetical protein
VADVLGQASGHSLFQFARISQASRFEKRRTSRQIKTSQIKTSQIKTSQIKTSQIKTSQIKTWRNKAMTRLKTFSALALLSMMSATPVFAQAAIQEPGAFAFYHPNADVLNSGAPTPARSAGAFASVPFGNRNAYAYVGDAGASVCARHHRSYDPASGTFLGYDGARHACR